MRSRINLHYSEDGKAGHMGKRLTNICSPLAEEKTKIVSFSRFRKCENTSFEFLGFEFRWAVSQKGKDIIKRRTSRNKLRKSIKNFSLWCKDNRSKRIRRIVEMLNSKYKGYYNYYGVIGNSKGINEFYEATLKILYKWMNRRSQRKSFNWKEFTAKMKWYRLIKPRVVEKAYNQIGFEECFA